MHGQKVGYIRVSTIEQNTDRQLEGVDLDRMFMDKASGKDTQRPELERLLAYVREGDTVMCTAWIDSPAISMICAGSSRT